MSLHQLPKSVNFEMEILKGSFNKWAKKRPIDIIKQQ